MSVQYPHIDELKLQARRLRQAMSEYADAVNHSTALELVAKQYGIRDWNTFSAFAVKMNNKTKLPLVIDATISGRYLNQAVTGKSSQSLSALTDYMKYQSISINPLLSSLLRAFPLFVNVLPYSSIIPASHHAKHRTGCHS